MDHAATPWRRRLTLAAAQFGVSLSEHQALQFSLYAGLLVQWNRKLNLTAITDPEQIAIKHFVDCLAALDHIDHGARLLDIGTGGGFPGLPLKIARPDLDVTLVDGARKKITFVNHLIRELKLDRARAIHARAETLAGDRRFRAAMDVITCRALGNLDRIIQLAVPLLTPRGRLIAYQGPNQRVEAQTVIAKVRNEQKQTPPQRPVQVSHHAYRLPFLNDARVLLVIDL